MHNMLSPYLLFGLSHPHTVQYATHTAIELYHTVVRTSSLSLPFSLHHRQARVRVVGTHGSIRIHRHGGYAHTARGISHDSRKAIPARLFVRPATHVAYVDRRKRV